MSEIDKAIKVLAEKIDTSVKPGDAMQYAQAALNLAHTASVLAHTKKDCS
jgi:hypothetical protein